MTITCMIKPFEEGFLVAYSWLKVKRKGTEIKSMTDYPLKEGPYNLTMGLVRGDFDNETTLIVTCKGAMLSHSCTIIERKITLLGLYFAIFSLLYFGGNSNEVFARTSAAGREQGQLSLLFLENEQNSAISLLLFIF